MLRKKDKRGVQTWDLSFIDSHAAYGDDALSVARSLLDAVKSCNDSPATILLEVSFNGEENNYIGQVHAE